MSNVSMKKNRKIPEEVWQQAESNQVRRERWRLRKLGRIFLSSVPNVMVKDDNGNWKFPRISVK